MKRRSTYRLPMRRRPPSAHETAGAIVAYDLETTRIPTRADDPLSVQPLFLTAYGEGLSLAIALRTYGDLGRAVIAHLLTPERNGTRYCAWNGNRFDVRLVMEGVIAASDAFEIHPFVAKQAGLRGVRVMQGELYEWTFLDGMAMLGLTCDLRSFLTAFAPEYPKGDLDLDRLTFDPTNAQHRAYAKRDAEGLYYGLIEADRVLREKLTPGRGVQMTIGNAGIKAFIAAMPSQIDVFALNGNADAEIRRVLMRGGYVYVSRKHNGAAWSYDLNQAYAAAMRDQDLPCGYAARTRTYEPELLGAYVVELSRSTRAPVPFYVRDLDGAGIEAFGDHVVTMLCTPEIELLRSLGWHVRIVRGIVWGDRFRMTAFVDRLESIRRHSPHGSPLNILCKSIGNNAYGKMNEVIPPLRYVISRRPPQGSLPYDPEDRSGHLWVLADETDQRKFYHRPHVAAFVTAHVRCRVFAAAMRDPAAFLKADTDSVTFSRPVDLPISSWRYGDWKLESAGERHIILGKKCYCRVSDPPVFVCKGLHVRRLSIGHYEAWYERGEAPVQEQMQLQNWRSRLAPTFRAQRRSGTNFA